MTHFISHWQQCQSFDILKIIKVISIESCIEILTSLGRSPPTTNELFLTKFWLSKYFGNNSSVFTAVMGDRMEERGWVFLNCLAFSRGLTPGNWGPQSSDVSPRISQETDIFRPFHFVSSVPWLIISISKCFEAKANRTFKKMFMCHVITVFCVFIGIRGTSVTDIYHQSNHYSRTSQISDSFWDLPWPSQSSRRLLSSQPLEKLIIPPLLFTISFIIFHVGKTSFPKQSGGVLSYFSMVFKETTLP